MPGRYGGPVVGGKGRQAHFPVLGVRIDGEPTATLTVDTSGRGTVRVRGYRKRREYVLPLAFAVQMIADKAAKLDAERAR
jgi:hypothetical protein